MIPSIALALPRCAMRTIFHVGCPTCGFTRAVVALARGDVAASLALHPLALPLAIEFAVAAAAYAIAAARHRPGPPARTVARIAALDAIAALAVWVIRLATGTVPA